MKKKVVALVLILVGVGIYVLLAKFEPLGEESMGNVNGLPEYCKTVATCGQYERVSCRAEVDGPLYYVNTKTREVVADCSEGSSEVCPPLGWECN